MKSLFFKTAQTLTVQGDQFIQRFGHKKFHEQAAELLGKAKLHENFDYKDLVASSFAPRFVDWQNFKAMEFSDLPLTIARGKECFIDVYFWRRRPTTIHNHHFNGAFQCLRGVNVDTAFKFEKERSLTRFHTLGSLIEKRTSELRPGDVEAIDLQDKFIHQNHHHDDLTVNLCFRTPDYQGKNLSNFLYSGLKIEKDSTSIMRAQRLLAFTRIDDFDVKKIDINLIDALNFLYYTYDSGLTHPRFLKVQKFLSKKVKDELGISLPDLMQKHEARIDEIQSFYE